MIPNLSIDFRSRGVSLSGLIKDRSLQDLEQILAPFRPRLSSVKVRFVDQGGSPNAPDRRCMIHLVLAGTGPIIAEAIAEQPMQAFQAAARRLQALLFRNPAFAPL